MCGCRGDGVLIVETTMKISAASSLNADTPEGDCNSLVLFLRFYDSRKSDLQKNRENNQKKPNRIPAEKNSREELLPPPDAHSTPHIPPATFFSSCTSCFSPLERPVSVPWFLFLSANPASFYPTNEVQARGLPLVLLFLSIVRAPPLCGSSRVDRPIVPYCQAIHSLAVHPSNRA